MKLQQNVTTGNVKLKVNASAPRYRSANNFTQPGLGDINLLLLRCWQLDYNLWAMVPELRRNDARSDKPTYVPSQQCDTQTINIKDFPIIYFILSIMNTFKNCIPEVIQSAITHKIFIYHSVTMVLYVFRCGSKKELGIHCTDFPKLH